MDYIDQMFKQALELSEEYINQTVKRALELSSPKIIAFEGIDGSGKTTALKAFSKELDKYGISHVCLQMIPEGCLREAILYNKELLPTQRAGLFIVAAETVKEQITQAKQDGKWILMDRCVVSNYVYQGHLDNQMQLIKNLIDAFGPVPYPNFIVYNAVSPSLAEDRIINRNTEPDHFENPNGLLDRLEQEVQGYLIELERIETKERLTKVIHVDGGGPVKEIIDDTMFQIIDHISL